MTTEPAPIRFTEPGPQIAEARHAIARLQRHLAHTIGPLDASCDLSSLALAAMSLESVHPPYPPLPPDIGASLDLRVDLDDAIAALLKASAAAETARETLRLAYVIRDLREIEHSPHLAVRPGTSARPL